MVRRRRHLAGARLRTGAAIAVVLASAADAHAQVIERFDPAERGSRFFVADTLELDGDMRFATGVVASYGNRLRTFKQSGGKDPEVSDLIESALWIHPGASLVMAPGARFALDVPIGLQRGSDVNLDNRQALAPTSPAFGDLRGSFDIRLAGRERRDVDGAVLAAGVSAYLPTGASAAYASDDFARVAIRLATSAQARSVVAAARVGYMYRNDALEPVGGVRLGSELNGVLALGYRGRFAVIGPELHGLTSLKDPFQRRSTPAEVLWGTHFTFGSLVVGAAIGQQFVAGLGAPRFRTVLSIEWVPSAAEPRDRDHDGVIDADDMCPDVPGLADAPLGARGCPAAPTDRDGDGIIDTDDACPDLPGQRSVLPRFNGCPPDSDTNGVPDERYACPDEAGVPDGDPRKNGCPAPPPAAQ